MSETTKKSKKQGEERYGDECEDGVKILLEIDGVRCFVTIVLDPHQPHHLIR
jgi:hypothetical protein